MLFTDEGMTLETPEEMLAALNTAVETAIPSFNSDLPSELISNLNSATIENELRFQSMAADLFNQSANFANPLYLEQEGATFGLVRKSIVAANVTITFTGTVGTVIPSSTIVSNEDGSQKFATDSDVVILSSGTVDVNATSSDSITTTIAANTITTMVTSIINVTCNNSLEGYTETAAETYDEYRLRLLDRYKAAVTGTYEAALTNLLAIEGVSRNLVALVEKVVDIDTYKATVVECVVGGGSEIEVAFALWSSFCSPISLYSNPSDEDRKITANITYNNIEYPIVFTRPDYKDLNIIITLNTVLGDILLSNAALTNLIRVGFDSYFDELVVGNNVSMFSLNDIIFNTLTTNGYSTGSVNKITYEITDNETGDSIEFNTDNKLESVYDTLYRLIDFEIIKE